MASKINALLLSTEGKAWNLELNADDPNAAEPVYVNDIQQAVGGYFEHVSVRPDMDFWVHEMGLYLLPPNPVASLIAALMGSVAGRRLFGDVVITGGTDSSGGTLPIPEGVATFVHDYAASMNANVRNLVATDIHEWAVKVGRPATAPIKAEVK